MKSFFNIVLFLFISTFGFSQLAMNVSKNSTDEINYSTPEISESEKMKIAEKQNQSTIKQLKYYLSQELKYSEIMIENGMEGQLIIQINISTDGSIMGTKIIESPHVEISKAILKSMEGLKSIDLDETVYYGHQKIRIPVILSLR